MKIIILLNILLFLVLNNFAHAQEKWPVNPSNGEVTLKIFKKWPNGVNNLSQKNAFVRKWYFHYLTDLKENDVKKWLIKTGDKVTYSKIPAYCFFEKKQEHATHKLLFSISILIKKSGVHVNLSDFYFSEISDDTFSTVSLEDVFKYDGFSKCKTCKESLNSFKARLDNL